MVTRLVAVVVVEEETLSLSSSASNHDLDSTRRSSSSETPVCRLKTSDSSGWHQMIMDGMVVVMFVGVLRDCENVLPDG
jgi:hypothetical protein